MLFNQTKLVRGSETNIPSQGERKGQLSAPTLLFLFFLRYMTVFFIIVYYIIRRSIRPSSEGIWSAPDSLSKSCLVLRYGLLRGSETLTRSRVDMGFAVPNLCSVPQCYGYMLSNRHIIMFLIFTCFKQSKNHQTYKQSIQHLRGKMTNCDRNMWIGVKKRKI